MRVVVCLAVAILLRADERMFAQSRATGGDLIGVISDPSGAVVPGAQIVAVDTETNLRRAVVSEPDGNFAILALAPSRYVVEMTHPGFSMQRFEDVEVTVGGTLRFSVVLTVAPTAEQVVVTGDPPIIDLQGTATATVIRRAQLDHLPIEGRNFVALSLLTPAVTVDRVPQQGAAAGSGLNFVGQRARSNNITVDGLDNNDPTVGSVRATFSQDAIQEFQVIPHSFPAEFGRASGGVVNIVTRSGTNMPSRTAFAYLRDDVLNAREYFERFAPDGTERRAPKAPFRQAQFGGVAGGPIQRDRTFYFASLERLSTRASNFVTIDDTNVVDLFGRPIGTAVDILNRAGFAVSSGYQSYSASSTAFLAKIDHRFDANHTATVRYNLADTHNGNIDPFGGIIAASRGGALDSMDHMLAGSSTLVRGPTVNELRVQLATRDQSVLPLDPACDGPCDRADEGGPTVEIAGVASAGRNRIYPQLRNSTRYQLLDTVSRLTGRHETKAGFDFNWVRHSAATLPLHYGGRYIFAPLPAVPGVLTAPVTALQAFALGLPAAYVQGYGESNAPNGSGNLAIFVQDRWRVRQAFTVKAGVRYQTQFWGQESYDVPGVGRYGFPVDRNDVAPRVAFAWNPNRSDAAAVHGAYGMFFDNQITSIAGVADIVDGTREGTRTLVLRFPQTIAAWQSQTRRLPEPATPYPSLVFSIDPDLKTPYAHHASIGLDRLVRGAVRIAADGVLVRGFNQLGVIDYNPMVPSLGAGRRPLDPGGIAGTSASLLQYTSFGETWYRAMMLSMEKRFDGRSQLLATYTLSRAQDTSSDFQTSVLPQSNGAGRNPRDPFGLPIGFAAGDEKGDALHDQRHRFVLSATYAGPFKVFLSGIVTASSGAPFNIVAGVDLNGDGDGGSVPTDRARRVAADPSTSVHRNAGRLPAQLVADLRVSRAFGFTDTTQIEILVEGFNLFNRANFTEVNNVFGAGTFPDNPLPTYGHFHRSGPPRQVQLGLRARF